MKKEISTLLTVIVLLSIFGGCNLVTNKDETSLDTEKDIHEQSTTLSKNDNEQVKIKIGWEFKNDLKVINNQEVPFTDVFLVLKGETDQKIEIGSYTGYALEIEDFSNRVLPQDTIMACQSWYAGGGDDLCVIYKENNTLSVLWRPVYESAGDSDDFTLQEFEEIKEIRLPDNATVEAISLFEDNRQQENKDANEVIMKDKEAVLEYNDESFKIAYELPSSQEIYYSDSKIILIKTGEDYKQLNDININDGFASFPELSPDKKNIAYISPYEFELYGNVHIYNMEDDINEKVVQVDYAKSDTAKVIKWLDDDRLLIIIGFGTGTISKGGDLYLYSKVLNKVTLIKEVEKKKEIIDFKITENHVILEIITWDDDCREYTTEFEELTFETIFGAK